ncbi:MAG: class I tRNA ligase family protein, partial [Rhodospirillaceae bacterium]|nr:class I tRNA ligase family protein [Rhodospirillaceae bacterium]
PHSWRSKAPVIFRATPQWFISMEVNKLRETALKALDATRFVPAAGHTRLSSMIATRPDWCISRQRAWGVPIAIFVEKATGEPLRDPAVLERIATGFAAEGSDAWFAREPADFLGADYDPADYEQVRDIVDVWFESGSTHAFVLETRADLKWPADLYLEGSDQHRGWFHSSLLESCGTRGRAPYDAVLTHGFVMDEQGRKMSKSLGNTVVPQDVCNDNGADILRLWVAGSDYSEDLRIGKEIIQSHVDSYRRLRNTLRYLLGALAGFSEDERIDPAEMPQLERWVLHRVWEIDRLVRRGVEDFDFTSIIVAVNTFCAVDLSAFYLDVRKDSLYCDRPDSLRRRAVRTVMDTLFECLTAWLAPITCFTAEEAWWTRHGEDADSVHERTFPDIPDAWRDDELAARWAKIREARRVVTGAIELKRAAKEIRASLEAHPRLFVDPAQHAGLLAAIEAMGGAAAGTPEEELADISITSQLTLLREAPPADAFALPELPGIGAVIDRAEGRKCERSWKILPSVGSDPRHPTLTPRDADAVEAWLARQGAAAAS